MVSNLWWNEDELSMEKSKFYRLFANLPLHKRFIVLDAKSNLTMSEIYFQIDKLGENLRPFLLEEQKLLKIAEKGFNNLKKAGK